MNIVDLMAREHVRLGRDLQQCIDEDDPREALRLARCALARTSAYLMGLQRCVFSALVAVDAVAGEVSAARTRFQQVKMLAAEALLRSGRHGASLVKALHALHRHLQIYAGCEGSRLHAALCRTLRERELELLGGELLMDLAANRQPDPAARTPLLLEVLNLLWVRSRSWSARLRRPQALPVLRHVAVPPGAAWRAAK